MDNEPPTQGWHGLRQAAYLHAQATAAMCSPSFVSLVDEEIRLFTSQQPPATSGQLDAIREQRVQLDAKIAVILHASVSAVIAPEAAADILDATRRFCESAQLHQDCSSASAAITSRIANLTASAAARR